MQPRMFYPARLAIQSKRREERLRPKLKDFLTTKLTLQEVFEGALCVERQDHKYEQSETQTQ